MEYSIYDREIEETRKTVLQKYKNPKAYIHTFGCQQNISDSEKIKGILSLIGYDFTDEISEADLVLFNTCAIREGAELKAFGNVGELKRRKQENPDIIVGICGCMVQQDRIIEKVKKSYPFVSICFGTHVIHLLPQMIRQYLLKHKRIFRNDEGSGNIPEYISPYRESSYRANVPIMNGCNNFCTYCVVPYVRGREKSREPEYVIDEVRTLVNDGYKEITLLGQNVNSYGKNLDNPVSFAELLKMVNDIPGDFLIRFMTSHPKDCTFELIDTIAECEKVSRHIHLPVQSGSNKILKAMNRGYTAERYLELVEYAKKKIPDVSFTSDIIVGFPGETYEDFLETVALIRKVKFRQLFTFIFSKRPGTIAARMDDPVPEKEKSKWLRELLDAQAQVGLERNNALINNTVQVLAEGEGVSQSGCIAGRTADNTLVEFIGDKSLIGNYVNIKITSVTPFAAFGELISY